MQALALEKQLTVVGLFQPTLAPPPRPRLCELPPVNENPPPPDVGAAAPSGGGAGRAPLAGANGMLANGGDDAVRKQDARGKLSSKTADLSSLFAWHQCHV